MERQVKMVMSHLSTYDEVFSQLTVEATRSPSATSC
jgi:hypothetical protein